MVFQFFKLDPIDTIAETFESLSGSNVETGAEIKLNTLTVDWHLDTHSIKQLLEVCLSSCKLLDEVAFIKNAVMKGAPLEKLLKMHSALETGESYQQYVSR